MLSSLLDSRMDYLWGDGGIPSRIEGKEKHRELETKLFTGKNREDLELKRFVGDICKT